MAILAIIGTLLLLHPHNYAQKRDKAAFGRKQGVRGTLVDVQIAPMKKETDIEQNALTNVNIIYWPKDTVPWGTYGAFVCKNSVVCTVSANRSLQHHQETLGFIWQGSQLDLRDLPLPRKPTHQWILYNRESPCNYDHILQSQEVLRLFNMTATTSDKAEWPLLPSDFSRYTIPRLYGSTEWLKNMSYKNARRNEDGWAPAVYIQSHCNAETDRDNYIHELQKFMDIDIYGPCLHNKDFPPHLKGWHLLQDSRFFEFWVQIFSGIRELPMLAVCYRKAVSAAGGGECASLLRIFLGPRVASEQPAGSGSSLCNLRSRLSISPKVG